MVDDGCLVQKNTNHKSKITEPTDDARASSWLLGIHCTVVGRSSIQFIMAFIRSLARVSCECVLDYFLQ
jgi:hypothetical protein